MPLEGETVGEKQPKLTKQQKADLLEQALVESGIKKTNFLPPEPYFPAAIGDALEERIRDDLQKASHLHKHLEAYEYSEMLELSVAEIVIGPTVLLAEMSGFGAALAFAERVVSCGDKKDSYISLFQESISQLVVKDYSVEPNDTDRVNLQIALAHVMNIFTQNFSLYELYSNKMSIDLIDSDRHEKFKQKIAEYVVAVANQIINSIMDFVGCDETAVRLVDAYFVVEGQTTPDKRWEKIIEDRAQAEKDSQEARSYARESLVTIENNILEILNSEPVDAKQLHVWLNKGIELIIHLSIHHQLYQSWNSIFSLTEERKQSNLDAALHAQLNRYIVLGRDFDTIRMLARNKLILSFEQFSTLKPASRHYLYKRIVKGYDRTSYKDFTMVMLDNLEKTSKLEHFAPFVTQKYLHGFSNQQLDTFLDGVLASQDPRNILAKWVSLLQFWPEFNHYEKLAKLPGKEMEAYLDNILDFFIKEDAFWNTSICSLIKSEDFLQKNSVRLKELKESWIEFKRLLYPEYMENEGYAFWNSSICAYMDSSCFLVQSDNFLEKSEAFVQKNYLKIKELKKIWSQFKHHILPKIFKEETLEKSWFTPLRHLFINGDFPLIGFLLSYPNLALDFIHHSLDRTVLKYLFDLPSMSRNVFSKRLNKNLVQFIRELAYSPQRVDKEKVAFFFRNNELLRLTTQPIKDSPILQFVLFGKLSAIELYWLFTANFMLFINEVLPPKFPIDVPFLEMLANNQSLLLLAQKPYKAAHAPLRMIFSQAGLECHNKGYCTITEQLKFDPVIFPCVQEVLLINKKPLEKEWMQILLDPIMITAFKEKCFDAAYIAGCSLHELEELRSVFQKAKTINAKGDKVNAWDPKFTKLICAERKGTEAEKLNPNPEPNANSNPQFFKPHPIATVRRTAIKVPGFV